MRRSLRRTFEAPCTKNLTVWADFVLKLAASVGALSSAVTFMLQVKTYWSVAFQKVSL